eukprot:8441061-Alexandrium_andersonii.AAC.1
MHIDLDLSLVTLSNVALEAILQRGLLQLRADVAALRARAKSPSANLGVGQGSPRGPRPGVGVFVRRRAHAG